MSNNGIDYSSLVSKVWIYAHVLRDQCIGYSDYVEQITFLPVLKPDPERTATLAATSRSAREPAA